MALTPIHDAVGVRGVGPRRIDTPPDEIDKLLDAADVKTTDAVYRGILRRIVDRATLEGDPDALLSCMGSMKLAREDVKRDVASLKRLDDLDEQIKVKKEQVEAIQAKIRPLEELRQANELQATLGVDLDQHKRELQSTQRMLGSLESDRALLATRIGQ